MDEDDQNLQADPQPEPGDGPSEDWLAQFERYAKDASSDQLRTLFAKLLAGKIQKPSCILPMTLHFVSMLDQKTASHIQRVFSYTIFASFDLSTARTLIDRCDPPLSVAQQLDLERSGIMGQFSYPKKLSCSHQHRQKSPKDAPQTPPAPFHKPAA